MKQASGMTLIAGYYWHELKKHPWHVVLLLLLVPAAVFLNSFAIAYIVAGVIDQLSQNGPVPLDQIWPTFGTSILLLIGSIVLGELVFWRLIVFIIWKLEKQVVFDLHMRCFNYLANQSAQFHADKFGGSLVSQTNKFVGSYIRLADSFTFQVLPFVWTLIFTLAILGYRVPSFAVGIAIIAIMFVIISVASYSKIRHLNEVESETNTKLSGHTADMISNVLAVKSFGAEQRELKGFEKLNLRAANATESVLINTIRRDIGFGVVLSLLMTFMFISILYGQAVLGIGVGTMVLMLTYSMNLFGQLWQVNSITRNYNRIYGDALPMAQILQGDTTVKDLNSPEKVRITNGEINFNAMSFSHDEAGEKLFDAFDLKIPAGQKIGLVGHSGSGKTSLTKLLLRFSDIDDGAIEIDGQNIAHIPQASLRKSIAYVPQEPLLFHRSLRENITYGKPAATDEEIYAAAKKAHATEFIDKLPKGYETLVGERGVKLSGGQRQRIAIARAILKDAPILVLDEATSALDSESERLIQTALGELMKSRTSIVIAHRLSTIQKMDRILVLENGAVIEEGSHRELLAKHGAYASMWQHQSGGFIEE